MNKLNVLILAGVAAGTLIAVAPAEGGWSSGRSRGDEIRRDRQELRESRGEFLRDRRDFREDKRELWRDRRSGASPAEIARDKDELRQSRGELRDSRREYWEDRRDLNAYNWRYGDRYRPSYGWRDNYNDRYDNRRYDNYRWRQPSSWWNWWR